MQWFIDTIFDLAKNYIDAYLATHPALSSFVDRGDNDGWDFFSGDFIKDNTWRDLDLSAIVPAGATWVLLRFNLETTIQEKSFYLRKKGNTSAANSIHLVTQDANVKLGGSYLVQCDANRVIQYNAAVATWTTLYINVNGWILETEAELGFINRGDPASKDFGWSSWGQGFPWYVKDFSAIIPASTSAVLLHVLIRSTDPNKTFSLRTLGNLERHNISACRTYDVGIIYEYDVVVPTAGAQSIEYQLDTATHLNVDVTVKGWWF